MDLNQLRRNETKEKFIWRHRHCQLNNQIGSFWQCIKKSFHALAESFELDSTISARNNLVEIMCILQTKLDNIREKLKDESATLVYFSNADLENHYQYNESSCSRDIICFRNEIEEKLNEIDNAITHTTLELDSILGEYRQSKAAIQSDLRSLISSDTVTLKGKYHESTCEIDQVYSLIECKDHSGDVATLKTLIRLENAKSVIETTQNNRTLDKSKRLIDKTRIGERCQKRLVQMRMKASERKILPLNSNNIAEVLSSALKSKNHHNLDKIRLQLRRISQAEKQTDRIIDASVKRHQIEVDQISQRFVMKERVDGRYEKLKEKEKRMVEALEKLKLDKSMKGERLKALAESVPYYNKICNKKADIFKSTTAAMNQMYQEQGEAIHEPRFAFQQGTQNRFSDERCFSDYKFKLSHALHEAGVAHSDYSREIVKQLIPRKPERTTGIEPF